MVDSRSTIRRKRFVELGLCRDCGKEPNAGLYCEKCNSRRILDRAKRKQLRNDRIKLGLCRDCGAENPPRGVTIKLCEKCYSDRKERGEKYKKINGISVQGNYNRRMRLKALQLVAGSDNPLCKKCGCSIINLLEINHLNHDGKVRAWKFYRNIVNGSRSVEDLNVLCKVCNVAYFVSSKFGVNWEINYV